MRRWNRPRKARTTGSPRAKARPHQLSFAPSRLARRPESLEERCLLTAIPTTIEVAASQSPVPHGVPVNLIATVAASPAPSEGMVTFTEGSTVLGSAAVASGSAQLTNVLLADGDHVITASYSDSLGNYGPSSTQVGGDSLISTVAGGGIDDNLQATSASLAYPWGIAFNSAGDLFIADTNMHRIRKVDHATGIITTVVGNGESIYSGDGGPATSAALNYPEGIAINSVGDLFVADARDQRIRKVDHVTGVITTVAGNGLAGYSGDGGLATAAELNSPASVAVDSAGNIFIADSSNSRIREVDAAGVISTVAGTGSNGYSGDGSQATSAQLAGSAQIAGPGGIAVNSIGDLFIADTSNQRIRRVDHATGVITTVAGDGARGFSGDGGQATSAELQLPQAITIDSAGDMFIADSFNERIRKVDATGVITTIAGIGVYGASGDGGQATAANLTVPYSVALNSVGDLFISDGDNRRIRKVDHATGVITAFAGNGLFGYFGDGGTATAAEFSVPESIALDSAGDQFILDHATSRIREVDHTTGIITTVGGSARGYFGDGGLATSAGLNLPSGVVVDTAGDLFIADTNNQRIRKIDHRTGIITTVAGNGLSGYSGDGGPATAARLYNPQGIAVDSAGNLFIADTYNERIRKVDHVSGVITTVAGNGLSGYYGEGIAATTSGLSDPVGVAIDSAGNLFVVDSVNPRVQKVDHATGAITTVAGNGHPAYSGDGGLATAAALFGPHGVAIDSAGNLFIGGGLRIRKVDHATGVITTVAGNGVFGYSGDGVPANSAALAGPDGLALDPSGDLFMTDNGRVREVAAHNLLLSVLPSVTVQDGYISGATVFYDANSNGQQDAGEPSATTGADGVAPLAVPSGGAGQLVVTGGVDLSTHLPLPMTLTAPASFSVVSPLTTLVNQLVQDGTTLVDAEQTVKNALGVPVGVALASYDAIAQGLAGDSEAASVFAAAAKVQDTIVQAANLVSGASGATTSDAAALVIAAIANSLSASSGTVDLADQATVQAILDAALSASGGASDESTVSDVASVIAQGNSAIGGLAASDYTAFLQSSAQVELVAQGTSSDEIKQVGLGNTSAASLAAPVVWDGGGGDLDWNNPLNWSTDTLPGPDDDVIIGPTGGAVTDSSDTTIHSFQIAGDLDIAGGTFSTTAPSSIGGTMTLGSGTLTLGGDTTAAAFALAGGQLSGDGDLTVTNSFDWSDGGIAPPATVALASGANGTIAGGGSPVLWGTLRNEGTLSVPHDLLIEATSTSVGTLENLAGGTVEMVDAGRISNFFGGSYGGNGPGMVDNAGTFGHSGTGISEISAVFDNTGTINAQDEALHFTGGGSLTGNGINGGINLEAGDFTIDTTGSGRLIVVGNINVADGGKASNLLLEGGRLSSPGTITVTGNFSWSNGELPPATTLVLPSGVSGTIEGGGSPVLWGTLRNEGTLSVPHDLLIEATSTSVGTLENLAGGTVEMVDAGRISNFFGGSYGGNGPGVVDNAGTFAHTGAGSSEVAVAFNNSGVVNVAAGAMAMDDDSLPFDTTGGLLSQPGAIFSLSGDLTGSLQDAALFTPLGTTLLNGFGSESAPQLLEAMSRDLGNGAASFTNNFAYGSLALGGSTYVRLVDEADNAAGFGPEAVYADCLTVPAGTTLDLNRLRLYAREVHIDGQVINGAVSLAPEATIDMFQVQKGAVQRSFIRYVDASISDASVAAALADSLDDADPTNDRVRLRRFELDGGGAGQLVPLSSKARAVDHLFSLDFGAGGLTSLLGGNANSLVGNGYYELDFDLDGDGTFETVKHFYRLAGDVNGDGAISSADQAAVNAAFGKADASVYDDINGDAVVNILDRALVAKAMGLSLRGDLEIDA